MLMVNVAVLQKGLEHGSDEHTVNPRPGPAYHRCCTNRRDIEAYHLTIDASSDFSRDRINTTRAICHTAVIDTSRLQIEQLGIRSGLSGDPLASPRLQGIHETTGK